MMENTEPGQDYQPISCDFYDEMVLHIQRKHQVKIIYTDEADEGQRKTAFAQLTDIETRKDSGEFVQLDNGNWIRLDRVLAVMEV